MFPAFDTKTTASFPPGINYAGIWDTGATNTVITEKVVNELNLKPTGMTQVHTASGTENRPTYLVNIRLPNGVGFETVRVSQLLLVGDCDLLIGMDIIALGDFAVTNVKGKTVFSYRWPSIKTIDFVAEAQKRSTSRVKPPVRKNRKKGERKRR